MCEPSEDTVARQHCILVLGMHRSGTSALSGTLSMFGYGLPATLAPADHNNPVGYFESKALWAVNDDLLAEIGSGWDDWTAVDMASLPDGLYQRCLQRTIDGIGAEYRHCDGPFILKDPRMCRLMPLWIDALAQAGLRPHVVHIHRHPAEVAASLQRRDGYDPAFGLLMWLRHVLEAEHATRAVPRCFTSFDLLMQGGQATARTVHQRLDLPLPASPEASDASSVARFLSAGLRHFDVSSGTAPVHLDGWWQDSFDILEKWAAQGESPQDRQRLDAIRSDLAALPPQVTALVRPGQLALLGDTPEALKLRQDIAERDRALEAQARSLGLVQAALAEHQAEASALHETLRGRDRALQDQARLLDRLRTDLAAREAAASALRETVRDQERALQDQARALEALQAEKARLHQQASRAQQDHHALLQSSSWRMTAPLRRMARLLRRNSGPT